MKPLKILILLLTLVQCTMPQALQKTTLYQKLVPTNKQKAAFTTGIVCTTVVLSWVLYRVLKAFYKKSPEQIVREKQRQLDAKIQEWVALGCWQGKLSHAPDEIAVYMNAAYNRAQEKMKNVSHDEIMSYINKTRDLNIDIDTIISNIQDVPADTKDDPTKAQFTPAQQQAFDTALEKLKGFKKERCIQGFSALRKFIRKTLQKKLIVFITVTQDHPSHALFRYPPSTLIYKGQDGKHYMLNDDGCLSDTENIFNQLCPYGDLQQKLWPQVDEMFKQELGHASQRLPDAIRTFIQQRNSSPYPHRG